MRSEENGTRDRLIRDKGQTDYSRARAVGQLDSVCALRELRSETMRQSPPHSKRTT
jgi:hypothetical protein